MTKTGQHRAVAEVANVDDVAFNKGLTARKLAPTRTHWFPVLITAYVISSNHNHIVALLDAQ